MTAAINLSGARALVTGSGHGLGRAIALALAEAGADVVVHYGSSGAEAAETVADITAHGRRSVAYQADVTDPAAVDRLVGEATTFLGGLDILVTNAGHLIERRPIRDMEPELWHRIMDVNATSTYLTCRAALPALEESKGVIVTMSSLAAHNGGGAGAVAYSAAKAAVTGFTRGLAKEVGPLGVRVNAVAPGFIAETKFHATFTPDEARPGIIAGIPLGRAGLPEDVAGVVLFLVSPLAAFVSGETVDITGAQWMR
jgi:NAD(P)-dependent dehydrogenase (short-subunit alcohol dehydrogenase family)